MPLSKVRGSSGGRIHPASRNKSLGAMSRFASKVFLGLLCCVAGLATGCGGSGSGGGGGQQSPALSAAVATQGNFSSGQANASYNINVTNTGTGPTTGAVTVADPPTGFTVTSIAGTGWSCTLSTTTCTRSDSLAAGASFPSITVTGNVTSANGTPVTISLSLSGGGMSAPVTSTPTVTVAAPSLTVSKSHAGNFTAGQQGATYMVSVQNASTGGATNARVTLAETVPAGETLVSISGTGWSCPGAGGADTCDRSDTLASGSSYPNLVVTVNVAAKATSPQVNQVSVSGGGMSGSATASDSTTIIAPSPDVAITASHLGNFAPGLQSYFTLAVSNVGTEATTSTITVTDTLNSEFAFVSASASGWTCTAAGQAVTCTNPGPVAAGSSAAVIPVIVNVSATAPGGSVSNTATVNTAGDTDASNNSSTDNINVLGPTQVPTVVGVTVPGPVIYAGGNAETVAVTTEDNDNPGDVITPSMTLTDGSPCTAALCGTISSVTFVSALNYSATYTPPAALSAPSDISLTMTSGFTGSIAGTTRFTVYPSGQRVVMISGSLAQEIAPGSGSIPLTLTVYADPGSPGPGATAQLQAAGYACPPGGVGATPCGTLTIGATTSGTTTTGTTGVPFTATALTYKAPATIPTPPYDLPMIYAVSNADTSRVLLRTFHLTNDTNLMFAYNSRLSAVLTGAGPLSLQAVLFKGDEGINKTINWQLTDSTGADCQPSCGTLGTPDYLINADQTLKSTLLYTPPTTVPASPADQPTLTATAADLVNGAMDTDSFSFRITDGTCGTGNESILNGQYAFLFQGGGSTVGYQAWVGSFIADGNGNITGGFIDTNNSAGPTLGRSIVSGSSFSVGPDNRGCMTLINSDGGATSYRISLGTLDGSNHATQGHLTRFNDYTGSGQRGEGILVKQDPTAFANSSFSGNYAFGLQGVDSVGAHVAEAGVETADGVSHLSNLDLDVDDGGALITNNTSASGTFSISSTGRGTVAITSQATNNYVLYVVDSSRAFLLSSDVLGKGAPILSGEARKQTAATFSSTSLDYNGYVFYSSGVDPKNGGNDLVIGQAEFAANGNFTFTLDEDDNGIINGSNSGNEQTLADVATIAANGRATLAQGGVLYLVGTDSAFFVGTDNLAGSGFLQQQSGAPFNATSLSGQFAFGGLAPVTAVPFDTGTGTLDGVSSLSLTGDLQTPSGPFASVPFTYSYAVTSGSTGRFTLTATSNLSQDPPGVGFIVSGSEIIFLQLGPYPGSVILFVGQK